MASYQYDAPAETTKHLTQKLYPWESLFWQVSSTIIHRLIHQKDTAPDVYEDRKEIGVQRDLLSTLDT